MHDLSMDAPLLVDELAGSPGAAYHLVKRFLDVLVALVALLVLAPLMLVVALAICVDSRGSAFYRQRRVGGWRRRNGEWAVGTFSVWKFRSMAAGASDGPHREHVRAYVEGRLAGTGEAGSFKLDRDPRITRVGALLRRTSLDELPQLFNVLAGDMSLVGPRPVPPYEVEAYEPWHRERLAALPGITGLWQVAGRCDLPFEDMIRLDIEYVRTRTLRLDVTVLARTLPAVLSRRGAG
jgi:lipopolysaccharide/colanic/teichoic acid biosynthesis glycosyltransferase